jgi:hypothetical protein
MVSVLFVFGLMMAPALLLLAASVVVSWFETDSAL